MNTRGLVRALSLFVLFSLLSALCCALAGDEAAPFRMKRGAVLSERFPSRLRVGDWVFRSGTGTDSRLIRHIGGGLYSHIGMVAALHPAITVLHATTDDFPDKQNQVLETPLADFLHPALARRYAAARPLFLSDAQKRRIAARLREQKSRPFVLNPRHKEHLYCTTLLAEAIVRERRDFAPKWRTVDVALFRGEYLFPEAFAEYPGIRWIWDSEEEKRDFGVSGKK